MRSARDKIQLVNLRRMDCLRTWMRRGSCAIPKLGYSSAKQGVDGGRARSFNVVHYTKAAREGVSTFSLKYGFRSRHENRLSEFMNFHVNSL